MTVPVDWPHVDDIPPMMGEPPLPRDLVAAPLDEEAYATWAPGRVPTAREALIADRLFASLNPPPFPNDQAGRRWDGQPSGLGLDCCEDSRSLCRLGLRYCYLLGICLDCESTSWRLMIDGWHGPVRGRGT